MEFNQESYDRNDKWGQDVVKNYLSINGWEVVDKEKEDYKVDIQAFKFDEDANIEVEVKANYPWTCQEDFPFDSVSFLGRKKKWAKLRGGFIYMIVCRETKAIVMCHSDIIYKEEYKQIKNIRTSDRNGVDVFYRVPCNLCQWVTLDDV